VAFRFSLIPRDEQFFELYRATTSEIQKAAVELEKMLSVDPPDESRAAVIRDAEHRCDTLTHDVIQRLHRTFITPFDREEIHRLISRMDDVLDLIQDTAESLVLYDIQKVTPEATQLAELVLRCAERVQSAVGLMASMADAPAILKLCQEIDKLESEADKVMRAAISELFRNETDTRQLIKLKAVYELLESATDKCQDVANVIESVVLENA